MVWEGRALDSLTEGDIDALIEGAIPEGRTIDYKAEMPGQSDAEKREFLADVSSFANSGGGHLVIGVEENAGIPVAKPGVALGDADAEQLRLDSTIRSGLAPRLANVGFQVILLAGGASVVVLRVPRSLHAPHMVTYQNQSRFFARTSAGKYQLDVAEIRTAFLLGEEGAERIRRFRVDRLALILGGDPPARLLDNPKLVLHLAPIGTATGIRVDPTGVGGSGGLLPLYGGAAATRYNLDGYLSIGSYRDEGATGYAQLFRNGSIEGVNAFLLDNEVNGVNMIPSVAVDESIVRAIESYTQLQRTLGVDPPIVIMLSLLGVRGMHLAYRNRIEYDQTPIDRDNLIIPEVVLETFDEDPAEVARPLLDAMWNAAGFGRCLHYDNQGVFDPHARI